MSSPEEIIHNLFVELKACTEKHQHERTLAICDKILVQVSGDKDALATKAIALILLDKYEEARKLIDKHSLPLPFEKAYCHYALGKVTEAKSVLDTITDRNLPVLLLDAQISYRLGDIQNAVNIYKELGSKYPKQIDADELITNTCAAHLNAGEVSTAMSVAGKAAGSSGLYELAFNYALALTEQREFDQALKQLDVAEESLRSSLSDEDANEDEIMVDLAPVRVQRAYIAQLQGDTQAALDQYSDILKASSLDLNAHAVAQNNVVSLKGGHDLFDVSKRMKAATADETGAKFTLRQRAVLKFNKLVLSALMNKLSIPDSDESSDAVYLRAYTHVKAKRFNKAEEILKGAIGRESDASQKDRLVTVLAQVYVQSNKPKEAAEALAQLQKCDSLGVISAQAGLYESAGDTAKATQVLEAAISHYTEQDMGDEDSPALTLLRNCAELKQRHGMYSSACQDWEKLLRVQGGADVHALAKLVICAAQFDPVLAKKYAASLPAPTMGAARMDPEKLEQIALPVLTSRANARAPSKKRSAEDAGAVAGDARQEKKKRKRKNKLPKNFDPTVPVDLERWLPKRERSYYKKSKRRKDIGKGPQGAAMPAAPAQTQEPAKAVENKPSSSKKKGKK